MSYGIHESSWVIVNLDEAACAPIIGNWILLNFGRSNMRNFEAIFDLHEDVFERSGSKLNR